MGSRRSHGPPASDRLETHDGDFVTDATGKRQGRHPDAPCGRSDECACPGSETAVTRSRFCAAARFRSTPTVSGGSIRRRRTIGALRRRHRRCGQAVSSFRDDAAEIKAVAAANSPLMSLPGPPLRSCRALARAGRQRSGILPVATASRAMTAPSSLATTSAGAHTSAGTDASSRRRSMLTASTSSGRPNFRSVPLCLNHKRLVLHWAALASRLNAGATGVTDREHRRSAQAARRPGFPLGPTVDMNDGLGPTISSISLLVAEVRLTGTPRA